MKRTAAVLLALAATSAAAPAHAGGGCVAAGRPLAEEAATEVRIDHACWTPGVAVVATGATLPFRNPHNGMTHNLSGPGIGFADLRPGTTHRVTFGQPGYYPFQCTIHAGMAGVVIVRDAPAVTPVADARPAAPAPDAGGGTGALPWAAAAGVVAVVAAVAFARCPRGVPVPAR